LTAFLRFAISLTWSQGMAGHCQVPNITGRPEIRIAVSAPKAKCAIAAKVSGLITARPGTVEYASRYRHMSEIVGWQPIALRLFLTVVAGFIIGFNRSEHGEPAGLRTTILVCLAASIAMIQANLLLTTAGRPPDSYVVFDLMRFPLGILTGVGFIGAGAIFRQGDLLRGVTTAATLWFVTVVGLCIGGGEIVLGLVGTAIGFAALWGLKVLEERFPRQKSALLVVTATSDGPDAGDVRARLLQAGFQVAKFAESIGNDGDRLRTMRCDLRWRGLPRDTEVPHSVSALAKATGVVRLQWKP
jgi:putative Mg2+ transporter-C (MgtC) family protein